MLLQRIADSDLFSSLREMQRLQQQLSRIMSAGMWPAAQEYPAVNVWTSEDGAVVRTELPGIDPNDVDISLVNDTLTIRGARHPEALTEEQRWHRQERGHGQFSRTLKLPFGVQANKVEARFSNGVLQVTLPRAEADKPRKIGVVSE